MKGKAGEPRNEALSSHCQSEIMRVILGAVLLSNQER